MSGRGSKAMRIKLYVRSSASDVFTFDEVQQALPDISADHIRSELRKLRDAGWSSRRVGVVESGADSAPRSKFRVPKRPLGQRRAGEAGDLPVAVFACHRHREDGAFDAGVDDEGALAFGPQ
jgi:hypothetical protein